MKKEHVRDWMTPDPLTVDPGLSVSGAYRLMKECGIRRLPVVEGNRLVGIVTLGDLRAAAASPEANLNIFEMAFHMERFTVMQIMTHQVVTVTPDTPIEAACDLMLQHKIGGLPVVSDRHLVGILTESDIFRLVAQHWSENEGAVKEPGG
jgi:acetoin utilization protein AcuB